MDFRFTDEQLALGEMATAVADQLARTPDQGAALLRQTGLAGLLIPESSGGGGATLVEAAIVAEQFGRARLPAWIAATTLLAPIALDLVGAEHRSAVADSILAGGPVAVAVDADLSWPPRGGHDEALAWGWHDEALVLVPDGVGLVPRAASGPARGTQDPATQVAPVEVGAPLEASAAAQRCRASADVVVAALLVGHMESALSMSVAYASERRQFGVPIGSFQAIKHLCADMLVDVESSRSAAYGAAAIVATGDDPVRAARTGAVAKAWCAEAAIRAIESAIQVHGGVGFTWEHDLHRHLRAAHVLHRSFTPVSAALDLITEHATWT